jgi:uncharacterized Zn-binding protein involved in type VI secretion
MGKLIVVENDKVEGTDKHNVSGAAINTEPPPAPSTVPNKWIGDFDYVGKMTDELSDFVCIDGQPVALKTSKSSLDPGEDAPPAGKHSGAQGNNLDPQTDKKNTEPANKLLLTIDDTIGEGKPSSGSGSSFVKVDGDEVLLDGDNIDTCDGMSAVENSTVTTENQDFVSCSA